MNLIQGILYFFIASFVFIVALVIVAGVLFPRFFDDEPKVTRKGKE